MRRKPVKKEGKSLKNYNRRDFLQKSLVAAGSLAVPYIIPRSLLGKGAVLPSNKVTLGCIGVGWMGEANMDVFLKEADCRVVAVCDLDNNHLENARRKVNDTYGNQDCKTYHDFRDLLESQDIDAVMIATPDHWHALTAVAAAKAGKDIYGEKPLAHSVREGRAICEAVERYNRIWQTGSWQRSESNFRYGCELVLNGRIGKVHTVEVGLPDGHADFAKTAHLNQYTEPPAELDYEYWLGPAPKQPYCTARTHKNWRWVYDFGGGQLLDWVGHHVDIAHWGLGMDHGGPLEVEGRGEFPAKGVWDTITKYWIECKYPGDIRMIIAGGYPEIKFGTKWIGEKGSVFVSRKGILVTEPESLRQEIIGPNEIHLYTSPGHQREFLDSVKSRQRTLTPTEVAQRSMTPGHLGTVSMFLGRKLKWDAAKELVVNDPKANELLNTPMRSPWKI